MKVHVLICAFWFHVFISEYTCTQFKTSILLSPPAEGVFKSGHKKQRQEHFPKMFYISLFYLVPAFSL